jgi:hypothetical protein
VGIFERGGIKRGILKTTSAEQALRLQFKNQKGISFTGEMGAGLYF